MVPTAARRALLVASVFALTTVAPTAAFAQSLLPSKAAVKPAKKATAKNKKPTAKRAPRPAAEPNVAPDADGEFVLASVERETESSLSPAAPTPASRRAATSPKVSVAAPQAPEAGPSPEGAPSPAALPSPSPSAPTVDAPPSKGAGHDDGHADHEAKDDKDKDAVAKLKADEDKEKKKAWYEKIKIGGYSQFRLSPILTGSDKIKYEADRSIGKDTGFFIRRARLIVQGEPVEMLRIYLQADFAGASSGDTQHLVAIRDWYGDIYVDPSTKMFRFRVGQQKVPYGWENMQSSSQRLNFDRSEGINSGAPGERDLGAMFYFETEEARALYKELCDTGLKGSGDYGMVGIGLMNGQTINKVEANDDRHIYGRINYPFRIGNQIMEVGVYGYTGQVVVKKDDKVSGGVDRSPDQRVGGSVILYPQPIGFQAEYNVGYGPARVGDEIAASVPLNGGYALVNARMFESLFPFFRVQRYVGGRKEMTNTPMTRVRELEGGVEYTFMKAVELTVAASYSERVVDEKANTALVLRTQLQLNY